MRKFAFLLMFLVASQVNGQTPPTPAPQPVPKPQPAPIMPPVVPPIPDAPPKAIVVGQFWPNPPSSLNPSDAPLGIFRLNASASSSTKPMKWQQKSGPDLTLLVLTPEGGPPKAYLEAVVTDPGTYTFVVVARGPVSGEIDADAAEWTYVVAAPAPPSPPAPVPIPVPIPPPPAPDPVPPTPTPQPIPVPPTPTPTPPTPAKGIYLVVVADTTDSTLDPVLKGPTLASLVAAQQGKAYGPTDAKITEKGYDKAMQAKGLNAPCCLILDSHTGRLLAGFALPATDAGLAAEIAKPRFR